MKYQIQEFTYSEETGKSTMFATSPYGDLHSSVTCAEEDKNLQNQWDGYRFCEYKIALQYLKYQCLWLKGRFQGAYDAVNTVYNYIPTDNPDFMDALFRVEAQAFGYEKIYNKLYKIDK